MQLFRSTKSRKHFHVPKKVWIPSAIALILVVVPVVVLGWMGLVPGISDLMGSTSQRNLGVSFTKQNLVSFEQNVPLDFEDSSLAPVNPLNTSEKQLLTQPVTVQGATLSQDEVTAMLDSYHWTWMPVNNTQVRFTDGTVELSGLLNTDHLNAFEQYIANGQSLNPNVKRLIDWSRHFRNNAPIYVKAQIEATNDILAFKLEQVQIGRFDIPIDLIGPHLGEGVYTNITVTNLNVQAAYFTDQTLHFSGTYPSVIYVRN
jgi:hypothetical protein